MHFKLPLLLLATFFIDSIWTKDCTKLKSNTKLFCYYGDIKETENLCKCTHVVLPEGTEAKTTQKLRKQNADVKILVTVSEFNEKLVELLKNTQVDGVELNLRKMDTKNDLMDFISTVKSKLGSEHYIAVSVPSKTEILAKNFDFKELSKQTDVFVLNTAFLGASQNVTFHPSRLSGLWDMQNTDSMVDLVSGLGAPLTKIVIAAPVQAFSFTLQSEKFTAPGSPATEVKSITRKELCDLMQEKGAEWTLERDQDQAGPYIFRGKQWIAFEDETSIDIKTKYARVRGLAGVALKDLSQDSETKCGSSILNAAFKGLSKQARAPRGAVLQTLEREILSPTSAHSATVHDSPFRISRIIDTEGKIHVVRQDTRTEFECSRQGYFVHPRSCNRFYRCVKFDQRTEEYNVFEFDCPAGLTFDEKTEVCVWPGSLPHASACSGSSEIAPVPQKRFSCPTEPGYYADPENCRWFFACLDHGEPSMQAYEFRCPFGLVFDEEKLLCEWPWLVPKCGLGTAVTLNYYGGVSTNINQYDGLGVLQSVKLGGLQGPIQAAEAKTYSNVGFVGLTDKTLTDGRLFSENSARFIDAARRLGLSLKATQSLYNAGLLSEKLAAIGLSQDDFGLKDLAYEVNGGLHQNFGQQNQYSIQNLNGLALTQSQQDSSNSGYDSQSSLSKNGGYILQSNIAGGNSASYNNLYQQSSSGGIKAGLNLQEFNTLDQSLQGQLNLQQQNGHAQLTSDNIALNGVNAQAGQEYSNLGGNAYSQSYIKLGQSGIQQQSVDLAENAHAQSNLGQLSINGGSLSRTEGEQLVQQVNLGADGYSQSQVNLGQHSRDQLTSSLKNIQLGQSGYSQIGSGQLIGGQVQYQQGYNKNAGAVSQSYVNLAQTQGELISGYSTAGQLNLDHSGTYRKSSEEGRLNGGGASLISSDNLKTGEYSNSYFNLGQSSGSQININQQGQQLNLESGKLQTGVLLETQKTPAENIEQLSIGPNVYRQNGEILLQNVEINGAAGTYTDDIAQSNLNLGLDSSDFTHVTPASVSHTTASSFESIVSATPLGTIVNYKGKQSVDTSAIEYSINNLAESKNKEAQSYNTNQASSYQFVQKEQPSFVSSTPSSVILQQNVQKLSNKDYSSVEYQSQPEISFNVPQVQYVTSTSRPVTQEVYIKTATSPSVTLQGKSQVTYSQQSPIVSFSTAGEKGIISGQSYSENGGYSYDRPSVTFEEKPVVSSTPSYVAEVKATTPSSATSYSYTNRAERVRYQKPQVVVQQPQVVIASTPSTGSSSSYFRQDSSKITYQTPQLVQQQPQVVSSYNYIKPETYDQPKITLVQQPQVFAQKPSVVATSYNYINQNQPQIQQTNSEGVSASFSYVQPEVKSQVYVQQPQLELKKQEAVVTSYNYVKPTSQSKIVFEQPQISIKQPKIVESYSVGPTIKTEIIQEVKPSISQSFSYSQQNSLNGYKYEAPQVSIQEQPQVTFQKPTISSSFNVESGYKYDRPSVVFEEGVKTVQPVVQQNIVQPVVQKEVKQPISQQQQVTSYQYFQPVVQQPRGFTKTSFQQEAVKTYSYSNPVRTQYIMKPASIVSTNYRAPVYKSQQVEFQGYGYPKPQVQLVEEPQAVVTNYENKVPVVEEPIVRKKAYVLGNSFQYQRTVPKVQFANEERVYATPKPTFISTINSIVTKKVNPQPQREFIYYDSRLDNTRQNHYFQTSIPVQNEIRGYSYPEPSIKFEESPRGSNQQSYQYYQSSQVEQRPVQIQQQTFSTPRPTYQSTIKTIINQRIEPLEEQFITTPAQIQYLESTTLKPISTVTTSYIPARQRIPNVEIDGYADQKSQGYSYQYSQQTNTSPQKQGVVEEQQYNRPVYYSTERPVEVQKVNPATQKYFYYDSRLTGTQAPEVQYVETSTRAPIIQKTQSVEFQGYDYPKPQVSFEEDILSYGNKIPVVEAPIVPKKAYVTTGESYTYSEKVNTQSRPVVLENFVAENYQQQNSNSQLGQIEYTTSRPTFISTVASVVAGKQPVNQEFTYYDNRYSGNSRTRLVSQKVKSSSSRGYSYPKPKVQLLEEPQQLLTTVEVNKQAQPTILENYVSPDYQKYDVSIQSSTPVTLLSQNVRQEVLRYDSRPQPEIADVTQGPIELNLKISSSTPAIVQELKQEQPIQPFYYYDSRLSSTEVPEIEVVQEKEQVPQVYRQEITGYGSRYSTSGQQGLKIKSRPSVTIIEQEQPVEKIVNEVKYTLDTSTEKQYVEVETREPSSTYLPIRKRIRVTKPSRTYLPTTPSTTYLPSSTPATVSNEYLPVSSTEASAEGGISVEDYQNFELVRKKNRPVKVVKIVRPRVKTVVVKKNDFNPFLSAKLGAQCTCTSNTIELRREPLRIEVTDDEEDEDDDGILVAKNDEETIVVENYESGKDTVTAEPEIYIKSSTAEIPSSTYRLKKVNRGRARAQNVVIENISRKKSRVNIEASDVNIVASRVRVKTPRIDIVADDNAEVNIETGSSRSKLVEVESGENVAITSKNFDRYGPGGLRSVTETLQGVDCQRAGLFRHPTQCNKFYSCRWDCKKNKFTLHMFNCPVHLTFDNNLGACNWPSQGPACLENTLLPSE